MPVIHPVMEAPNVRVLFTCAELIQLAEFLHNRTELVIEGDLSILYEDLVTDSKSTARLTFFPYKD
jgi:hypothetical protein